MNISCSTVDSFHRRKCWPLISGIDIRWRWCR